MAILRYPLILRLRLLLHTVGRAPLCGYTFTLRAFYRTLDYGYVWLVDYVYRLDYFVIGAPFTYAHFDFIGADFVVWLRLLLIALLLREFVDW